ncbi:TetR family transcriptional regulator [Mycobacterium sp.]|uniref:TetR/AcrR family transcriptional regulator n=1 Tax=Mycobacterium sp. TaxID=1785 RepID=UPI003F9B1075
MPPTKPAPTKKNAARVKKGAAPAKNKAASTKKSAATATGKAVPANNKVVSGKTYAPRTAPRVRRGTAPKLLLDAAQQLFAERGPYAATTKQIAERAGVSEDLIFRYYGSKNGLLKEAVFRPMIELIESLTPRWAEAQKTPTDDEHARSRVFVGTLYDLVYANKTIAMTMVQVMFGAPGELDDAGVHKLTSSLFEPEAPSFDDYLKRRRLRRGDPKLQLRIIMTMIGSTAAFLEGTYADPGDAPDRDAVIDELVDFIHYGLKFPD